jgi:protein-S-isoprenylcysteine O-methyltransferase Ste14
MRSRWAAAVESIVFFLLAPTTLAGVVPRLLTGWRAREPLPGGTAARWAGVALIVVGAAIVVDAFARFVRHGRGTPAPPLPTERLVVTGLYRYVRNPMYLGVLAAILGQALLLGSPTLLVYAALVGLGFHIFVLGYEEPALQRQFGAEYEAYRRGVRRWLPRLRSWTKHE